jgi:hypothetical protein
MQTKWDKAVIAASGREATHAIARPNYPRHTTGVARLAFMSGAIWAKRYLARTAKNRQGK